MATAGLSRSTIDPWLAGVPVRAGAKQTANLMTARTPCSRGRRGSLTSVTRLSQQSTDRTRIVEKSRQLESAPGGSRRGRSECARDRTRATVPPARKRTVSERTHTTRHAKSRADYIVIDTDPFKTSMSGTF